MRHFLLRLGLFIIAYIGFIIVGLMITRITRPQNLHFALIDKHERMEKVNLPRIIFVGGSNLSFGLDSREIQSQLHINVINTSVHAGMGLKYIIEDIIPYLKNNDIVVLSPEYSQFYDDGLYGHEPMVSSIVALPETYRLMNWQNWKSISSELPERALKNILKSLVSVYYMANGIETKGIYDRDSFNEFGDVDAHYGKLKEPFITVDNNKYCNFNMETIEIILSLKREVEKKDGKILFTYPCLTRTSYNSIKSQVFKIKKEIETIGIEILGTPDKYSLPDSLYFNSNYHLIKKGVDLRTKLLINDLKRHNLYQQK